MAPLCARKEKINTDADWTLLAVKIASCQRVPPLLPVERIGYIAPELVRFVDALCVRLPVFIDGPGTLKIKNTIRNHAHIGKLRVSDPTCADAETLAGGACSYSAIFC
jgi:hypothetical protein